MIIKNVKKLDKETKWWKKLFSKEFSSKKRKEEVDGDIIVLTNKGKSYTKTGVTELKSKYNARYKKSKRSDTLISDNSK